MLRVIDYKMVSTNSSIRTFMVLVRQSIEEGWQPHGSPILENGYWYQAMVLHHNEDSDTQDRHSF